MERHALDHESSVHELQAETHDPLHGGSRRPDDQLAEEQNKGVRG